MASSFSWKLTFAFRLELGVPNDANIFRLLTMRVQGVIVVTFCRAVWFWGEDDSTWRFLILAVPNVCTAPRTSASISEKLNTRWHERALQIFMFVVLAHWAEHLVQAYQVYVMGWPRPKARACWGCGIRGSSRQRLCTMDMRW